MVKIKVALYGIYYPLAMLTYFWRALQRRDDIELWTCGPYTGNWIPWTKEGADPRTGMFLPQKYVKCPSFPLPQSMINYHLHPEMIKDKLPWTPDLSLIVDAGWHFSVRPPGKVVALIETDPHVLKPTYEVPKSYSDFTFCMQSNYMGTNEIYLPYAYDPTVHYPEEREKKYDVCLVGLLYPQRAALINKLRSDGLSVFYDIGLIFDEYREVYNQSRIALSWSTLDDLPARVWEGMAMGKLVVSNYVPDLESFFDDGVDYIGFNTIEEAEMEILGITPKRLKGISEHGRQSVAPHTYDARIQTVLETVGLL